MTAWTAWLPTPALIGTKILELRRRRALMIVAAVFTIGVPVLVLGVRAVFHLVNPVRFGPASNPSVFAGLSALLAGFGFIIAATVGATAGTTDLTDGVFRHLVITGRSRLALYLARIPAGLAILVPLVGLAFAILCVGNAYQGQPQPSALNENGVAVPVHLDQAQLTTWLHQHPQQAEQAYGEATDTTFIFRAYTEDENNTLNPSTTDIVHIGLWIELDTAVAFTVGLGLGSLLGQRTVTTILMIVLDLVITPEFAKEPLPYVLNGQRALVGVAMDQLRPAAMVHLTLGPFGGGPVERGLPPMPTWAMITVIVAWLVGWSALGAWRMVNRDA
jgi:hypothetical protein